MKKDDIELLWMFTLRIGMYTRKENPDTISSFIHGYEAGRKGECMFIKNLINSVYIEYQIPERSTGWIGQIEIAAEKNNLDWVTIFKAQSFKVLANSMNLSIDENLLEVLKKRVIGKVRGVHNYFQRDWITDWFGIIHIGTEWFDSIWTQDELELIAQIEEELKSYGDLGKIDQLVNPSVQLKEMCTKLEGILRNS